MQKIFLPLLLILLCASPVLASSETCGPLSMSLPPDWYVADGPTHADDGMCYITVGSKDDTSAVTLGIGPKGHMTLEQHTDKVAKLLPARNPAQLVNGRYTFPFIQNGVNGNCTVSEDRDYFLFVCTFGQSKQADAVISTFQSKEYPALLH